MYGRRVRDRPAARVTRSGPAPSNDQIEAAAELLKVLANPIRVSIVLRLAAEPMCVHEIVDALGISQPLASQHLRILRAARLVDGERRGREIAYRIVDDHVSHIVRDAITHGNEEHP